MNKREFIKTSLVTTAGLVAVPFAIGNNSNEGILGSDLPFNPVLDEYVLPPLPYAYNALEPHIDEATMKLHHDIHHNGYVTGLNKATASIKDAILKNDYGVIKHWERELAFHGAGHFLHTIFWEIMGPNKGMRSDQLNIYINKEFGSYDNWKAYFAASANAVEGSGWAILAYEPTADKLVVLQAEKHSNQSQWTSIPILVIDVWEHAYYLKYQNKRKDYVEAFFNVINWDAVSMRLSKATHRH